MKAQFLTSLILKDIDGKFVELNSSFCFYSKLLDQFIWVPKGFITDLESVPIFRSTSKRAGVIHDALCRIGVKPSVTKRMAAKVYLEAMTARDQTYYQNSSWFFKSWLWFYRHFKSFVVRYAWGYWKKHRIDATYKEMKK